MDLDFADTPYCSPSHQDSPLWPVIAQLKRAAGLSRSDDPAQKLNKLAALLAQGGDDAARSVPLIASLLSTPSEACSLPLNMTAQQQRDRTLVALVDQLAGLAADRPVIFPRSGGHLNKLGMIRAEVKDGSESADIHG